ncbi:MAG: GIY-YIG nuclease family protein [Parvularculaceae bacterium]
MKQYYVYILASCRNGTLYVGVTNNIGERAYAHREGRGSMFTSKYDVKLLVYFEVFDRIDDAIAREKILKKWKRRWKIDLIESMNPGWNDLYLTLNH